jgi:hypothetical protein
MLDVAETALQVVVGPELSRMVPDVQSLVLVRKVTFVAPVGDEARQV